MKNDLIERYVYAVTKKIPSSMREDVSKELNTLISDMLEERCKGVLPGDKDIRVVLTELGTTSELAAQYNNNNGKNCLIGEPYYSHYKTVLKIVVIAAGAGMGIASILSLLIGEPQPWYEAALECFGMIWMGIVTSYAFITALFAVFYHKDVALGISENLDELPEVPKKQEAVSKGECIVLIVLSVVFMLLFLIAPQYFGTYVSETKEFIPIFNIEIIRSSWFVIAAFGFMGIAVSVLKLIDGCISKRVAVSNAVMNVISLFLASFWLLQDNLINPAFLEWAKIEHVLTEAMPYLPKFILAIIVLSLIGDTIVTLIKWKKSEK